MEKESYSKSWC